LRHYLLRGLLHSNVIWTICLTEQITASADRFIVVVVISVALFTAATAAQRVTAPQIRQESYCGLRIDLLVNEGANVDLKW
jgi:uncharacterized membrane protein